MSTTPTKQPGSLRRYQEMLSRRIAAAATTARDDVRLGVRVGKGLWLLRLPDAGEVMPIPPLTPVPLTRSWFRGLSNVRGTLYAVVDLAEFSGGAPTRNQQTARMLLAGQRYRTDVALIVDRVLGLRRLDDLVAAERSRQLAWAGNEYRDARGDLWAELDVAALLQAPEFLDVTARGLDS
jgi:twitching motility protein PilI